MKTIFILLVALALVGCASTKPTASLNAEQARTVALRLANERALKLYHCAPFQAGRPARWVAGHWAWADQQGMGHSDLHANVELAADGSAHQVDVQLWDSQTLF